MSHSLFLFCCYSLSVSMFLRFTTLNPTNENEIRFLRFIFFWFNLSLNSMTRKKFLFRFFFCIVSCRESHFTQIRKFFSSSFCCHFGFHFEFSFSLCCFYSFIFLIKNNSNFVEKNDKIIFWKGLDLISWDTTTKRKYTANFLKRIVF